MSAQSMELLAPAGDFDTARVAFAAGADAVYCGMTSFSARADAKNFTIDDFRGLLAYARSFKPAKKVYVTFNTVVDEAQLPSAVETLAELEDAGPDALIVQDIGVARIVRESFPGLALHASTQLVAHNLEGVLAMRDLGFSRVVLARELSAAEIASIADRCGVELEVFVHGALCYSISGLCLFSAMEKNRSGNRGQCAYCCRLGYADATGAKSLPFSMKDLRLDRRLAMLEEAGVASLKIEGRMKSPVYVGSVTKHYRMLLDALDRGAQVDAAASREDMETVFSRRTTELYISGRPSAESPVDGESLGHLGAPIGKVKRVTRDREGRAWLRFHTSRALEKHDGLQFLVPGGKPCGFGISAMRLAISRKPVFEAPAGSDVEVLVEHPDEMQLGNGATVYCSSSNAVKRAFPVPPFRPSELKSGKPVDVELSLSKHCVTAIARVGLGRAARPRAAVESGFASHHSGRAGTLAPTTFGLEDDIDSVTVEIQCELDAARDASKTYGAARKAFDRLGESGWRLGRLDVADPEGRFAPPSLLNDLRRDLVEKLDGVAADRMRERVASALKLIGQSGNAADQEGDAQAFSVIKVRADQLGKVDTAGYDEVVVSWSESLDAAGLSPEMRIALPVFTPEPQFGKLRSSVKRLVRAGFSKWEASDLATLRLLKLSGVSDITADWSLYAFNSAAAAELAEAGVSRFTCSPENGEENLEALAGIAAPRPEFLESQSTPLFISLTKPSCDDPSRLTGPKGDEFVSFKTGGLWITVRADRRTFHVPAGARFIRTDLSWDPLQ